MGGRAVAGERLRIARELHDVVPHGLSLIAMQAAALAERAGLLVGGCPPTQGRA